MATAQPEARRRSQQLGARRQRPSRAARTVSAAAWARPALVPTSARSGSGARTAGSEAPGGARARPPGSPAASWAAAWRIAAASGASVCDEHPSRALAAPAAPGELGDQREGALLGAEVGEAQRRVGVEHHAQHDIGEVVALGDHLGAHQHPRRRPLEAPQDLEMRAAPPAALSESSRKTGRGATPRPARGQPLGPGAIAREGNRAASGQDVGHAARRGRSGDSAGARSRLWRTSETSQCGHSQACPQDRQQRNGDQPRRLRSTIALPPPRGPRPAPPGARLERARAAAAAAHVDHLHRRAAPGRRPGSGSSIRAQPQPALGPRAWRCRHAAPPRPRPRAGGPPRGRRSAGRPPACRRRRAPRRRPSGRGRATGAKTAERGPTQIRASPARRRCHSSRRSPARQPRVQHARPGRRSARRTATPPAASARSPARARSRPRPRSSAASAAAR